MQTMTAPAVFNPRAYFDGKKNLFSVGPLKIQGTAAEVRENLRLIMCKRKHEGAYATHFPQVRGQHERQAPAAREHTWPIPRQANESK
jgi:hypothetical protein